MKKPCDVYFEKKSFDRFDSSSFRVIPIYVVLTTTLIDDPRSVEICGLYIYKYQLQLIKHDVRYVYNNYVHG